MINAVLANFIYGFPAKKIKIIGVTGTNGKTTTVQMISRVLEKQGKKYAMCSTINFQIGNEKWVNKTKFTTLNAWQVQKFIKRATSEGCEYLVQEVSSHSLDQNRVWGMSFDVVVITNITREHLDYHKTMEDYRNTKLKMFKMTKAKGKAVVNLEMDQPEQFVGFLKELGGFGYAISKNDLVEELENERNIKIIRADITQIGNKGSEVSVGERKMKLQLVGQFNIENALAALCVGLTQNFEFEDIAKALSELKNVPGRMEYVQNKLNLRIIIDYALTPDSMEKLGSYMENVKGDSKIIWVFGSCGERDRGKRPIMGEIVSNYADYAIVTNEDPYGEDPQQIINEVFAGIKGMTENSSCFRIMDRAKAIKKALELAHENDIVLVTGKGAEETMAIGKERIDWNDRKVIEGIVANIQRVSKANNSLKKKNENGG